MQAHVLAGLPLHIPGITVNRLCSSGLSAIIMASQMIKSGAADIVIAGGVESMSRAPWVQEKPRTAFAKPGEIFDTSIGWRFVNPLFEKGELARDGKMTYSMPETAEEVARVDGISREDADAFAVRSHERAIAAIEAGRFAAEIVPVAVRSRKGETIVDTDEGPRPGTTMDVLAGLRPVVAGGSGVTAGNSSTLNDGASAIIVASEATIEKLGLTPRARIVDGASAGCEPEIMGIGPVPATRKVLARAGPDDGLFHLRFRDVPFALLQALGHVRLPPYITHDDTADDAGRYQTVFATKPGAVAAPTAPIK